MQQTLFTKFAKVSEIVVDNFAGGGGASEGIKIAIGRDVDIAINHDPAAIAMHKANHPLTEHYNENVWDIDPVKVTGGRPVALCWFSPDCKHFSKAKGGKPVDKNIRGLAWVALRWAATVKPRVIMLENVIEFLTWGPLRGDYPDPARKGRTFNSFVNALHRHGYEVEWKELRACDYGSRTIRKRFFLIARRDGSPIVWPEPTHGDPDSNENVSAGLLKPWHTAAECIDWSIPCPSIFERKKPLAETTMRKIANGLDKFVLSNPNPYIAPVSWGIKTPYITQICQNGFAGDKRSSDIRKPLTTICTKNEHMLITPHLIQYHGERRPDEVRGQSLKRPLMVVDASNRYGLVTSHLIQLNKNVVGQSLTEPLRTITAGGWHFGEVRAFLLKYYGQGGCQRLDEPLHTITTKDRFGLVTVMGQDYQLVDIGMRMLSPRELFRGNGFRDSYVIDYDYLGRRYPKTAQVARCGNSVPPQFATVLVRANLPEICIMAA